MFKKKLASSLRLAFPLFLSIVATPSFAESKYWVQTGFLLGSPFFGQTLDFKLQQKNKIYSVGLKGQETGAPCFITCSSTIDRAEGDVNGIQSLHFMHGHRFAENWIIEAGIARVKTSLGYSSNYKNSTLGIPVRLSRLETFGYVGFSFSVELLFIENKAAYAVNVAAVLGKF